MTCIQPWLQYVAVFITLGSFWRGAQASDKTAPFEITIEAAEAKSFPVGKLHHFKLTKVNGHNMLNINFTIAKAMPEDTMVSATAYEKWGNAYSILGVPAPMMKLIYYMSHPKFMYGDLQAAGNFPPPGTWPAGNYYVENYKVVEKNLPPEIPGEAWKLSIVLSNKTNTLMDFNLFVSIKRHTKKT